MKAKEIVEFSTTFSTEGDGNTLVGMTAPYNTPTFRNGAWLQFAPGAFDEAIKSYDVIAAVGHDYDKILGRTSANTLTLDTSGKGIGFTINLPNTTYANDLKESVSRGDITSASFGILGATKTMSKHADGKALATYTKVDRLLDVSPVTMPQFDSGTSVELHSEQIEEENKPMTIEEFTAIQKERELTEDELNEFEGLVKTQELKNRNDALKAKIENFKAPARPNTAAGLEPVIKDAHVEAFESYLRTGMQTPELFAQTVASNGAGGYTVPTQLAAQIVDIKKAFGGTANVAQILTTPDGRPWNIVTINDNYVASGVVLEGGAVTDGHDLTFGEVTLHAYKYESAGTGNLPLRVSVEALQDSNQNLADLVTNKLALRLARAEAKAYVSGAGTTEPTGILSAAASTTLASGTVITYNDLVNVETNLDPNYRDNATWIFNANTAGTIKKMVDTVGRPLWMEQAMSSIGNRVQATLLGYPVVIDNSFPNCTVGAKFAVLGDIKEAFIVREIPPSVAILANPYEAVGYVTYYAWERTDSAVVNATAMSILTA